MSDHFNLFTAFPQPSAFLCVGAATFRSVNFLRLPQSPGGNARVNLLEKYGHRHPASPSCRSDLAIAAQ
jgi:hypothetical protein